MKKEAFVNLGMQKIAQDTDARIKRMQRQIAEKENEEFPDDRLTPEGEKSFKNEAAGKNVGLGAGLGMLAGGVAGGLGGASTGNTKKEKIIGGLLGAGAGSSLGFGAGGLGAIGAGKLTTPIKRKKLKNPKEYKRYNREGVVNPLKTKLENLQHQKADEEYLAKQKG